MTAAALLRIGGPVRIDGPDIEFGLHETGHGLIVDTADWGTMPKEDTAIYAVYVYGPAPQVLIFRESALTPCSLEEALG